MSTCSGARCRRPTEPTDNPTKKQGRAKCPACGVDYLELLSTAQGAPPGNLPWLNQFAEGGRGGSAGFDFIAETFSKASWILVTSLASVFLLRKPAKALPYSLRSFFVLPVWQTLHLALGDGVGQAFLDGSPDSFFTYLESNSFLKASIARAGGALTSNTPQANKLPRNNELTFFHDYGSPIQVDLPG